MEELNVTAAPAPVCEAEGLPEELLRHSLLLFADDEQCQQDCAAAIDDNAAGEDSGSRAAAEASPADAGLPLEQPCQLTSYQLVKREVAAFLVLRQELAERLRRAPRGKVTTAPVRERMPKRAPEDARRRTPARAPAVGFQTGLPTSDTSLQQENQARLIKKDNPLSCGKQAAVRRQDGIAPPKTTKKNLPEQRQVTLPARQAPPVQKSAECLSLPLEAPQPKVRHSLRNRPKTAHKNRSASIRPGVAGLSQEERRQAAPCNGTGSNATVLGEQQRFKSSTHVVPPRKETPLSTAKKTQSERRLEHREMRTSTHQQRVGPLPNAHGFAPLSLGRDKDRRFSMLLVAKREKSIKSGTMEI